MIRPDYVYTYNICVREYVHLLSNFMHIKFKKNYLAKTKKVPGYAQ